MEIDKLTVFISRLANYCKKQCNMPDAKTRAESIILSKSTRVPLYCKDCLIEEEIKKSQELISIIKDKIPKKRGRGKNHE